MYTLQSCRRPQVSPEVSAGAIRLTTGRYLGAEDAKAAVAALVVAIGPRGQVMHNNKMTSLILLIIYQSKKTRPFKRTKGLRGNVVYQTIISTRRSKQVRDPCQKNVTFSISLFSPNFFIQV